MRSMRFLLNSRAFSSEICTISMSPGSELMTYDTQPSIRPMVLPALAGPTNTTASYLRLARQSIALTMYGVSSGLYLLILPPPSTTIIFSAAAVLTRTRRGGLIKLATSRRIWRALAVGLLVRLVIDDPLVQLLSHAVDNVLHPSNGVGIDAAVTFQDIGQALQCGGDRLGYRAHLAVSLFHPDQLAQLLLQLYPLVLGLVPGFALGRRQRVGIEITAQDHVGKNGQTGIFQAVDVGPITDATRNHAGRIQ